MEMVTVLCETEKVDLVVSLCYSGLEAGEDRNFADGDDERPAASLPDFSGVVGHHKHAALPKVIIVNDRRPVVQAVPPLTRSSPRVPSHSSTGHRMDHRLSLFLSPHPLPYPPRRRYHLVAPVGQAAPAPPRSLVSELLA